MVNAKVGDWVRIHEDACQDEPRIPSNMPVPVSEVEENLIVVVPIHRSPTTVFWHTEYDVVPPPYIVGDPPAGTTTGWIATTETHTSVHSPHTEPDMVNLPPHYKLVGDVEVIDVIEALARDDAWYANAIKYLLRAKKKGKLVEDLGKCKFYIDRMLRDAESEAK